MFLKKITLDENTVVQILKGTKDNVTGIIMNHNIDLPEIKDYKIKKYMKIYETNKRREMKKVGKALIPDLSKIVEEYL